MDSFAYYIYEEKEGNALADRYNLLTKGGGITTYDAVERACIEFCKIYPTASHIQIHKGTAVRKYKVYRGKDAPNSRIQFGEI